MLETNKHLLTLNIESNLLTGAVVADICRATLKNQSLIDLRLSNQVNILPKNHDFIYKFYVTIFIYFFQN